MKKFLALSLSFASVLGLAGCLEVGNDDDADEILLPATKEIFTTEILDELIGENDSFDNITTDVVFIDELYDTDIKWSIQTENVEGNITSTGDVTRPSYNNGNVEVELSFTFDFEDKEVNASQNLVITKLPMTSDEFKLELVTEFLATNESLNNITENVNFVNELLDTEITWTIETTGVDSNIDLDGTITRPSSSEENIDVEVGYSFMFKGTQVNGTEWITIVKAPAQEFTIELRLSPVDASDCSNSIWGDPVEIYFITGNENEKLVEVFNRQFTNGLDNIGTGFPNTITFSDGTQAVVPSTRAISSEECGASGGVNAAIFTADCIIEFGLNDHDNILDGNKIPNLPMYPW